MSQKLPAEPKLLQLVVVLLLLLLLIGIAPSVCMVVYREWNMGQVTKSLQWKSQQRETKEGGERINGRIQVQVSVDPYSGQFQCAFLGSNYCF